MAGVKGYYAITTKKFVLRTPHTGWLYETQKIYNEILIFYYQLFLEYRELHDLGNQKMMRAMEQLTVVGRDKKPVERPLPFEGVPMYLRRAAINAALAAAKSYLARDSQERSTEVFEAGVTLYKGMYKELTGCSVKIKVWNGERWVWIHCRLSGNYLPEDGLWLSPRLVFRDGKVEMHVPVQQAVPDGQTLKERMGKDTKLCSVQFTNEDAVAIGCVVDEEGQLTAVRFFKGGKDYAHRCRRLGEKIELSQKVAGQSMGRMDNKRYWKKLKQVSSDMSHKISRQIVDFCVEKGAGIIVLPKYSSAFTKYVMAAVGNWSPLHLNYQIRSQLGYKAWQSGILVIEAEVSDIRKYCSVCGGAVRSRGGQIICENGHQRNPRVNAAVNLGRKTWKNLRKHMSGA